jgi:hypothetical protein
VQGVKRATVQHFQSEMMQTDVATAVERDALLGILDLLERHDSTSVRHERRWIILVFADNSPAEAITKEATRKR